MFGRILDIHEYNITLENAIKKVDTTLVGVHIVFEGEYKLVAEITRITFQTIECQLVGEFIDNTFRRGVLHKVNSNCIVRVVNKDEVILLVGNQEIDSLNDLYIGKSLIYDGFNVSANIDEFFSNHYAILGNTGSGKSCTVARLFQNLFYRKNNIPYNSRFVLFDVFGEYHNALRKINLTKYCRYKVFNSDISDKSNEIIKIPPYFLEVDDIALLLNVDNINQLPIIEKALRYVYLFTEEESKVIAYKNNIIAKAIMDILTSGNEPAQIRDQVFAILTTFHTSDLNLDSEIVQPGYVRTLAQCFRIDETGKINSIQLVTNFVARFINDNLKLNKEMVPKKYNLNDLYYAFEFALISEGVLKSDKIFDLNNILKVRLDSIINGDYGEFFNVDEYITKEEYINRLFTNDKNEFVQIINFNLNHVDERFAKILTKLYSKLFFNYATSVHTIKDFSVNILLEEAHRYVQNDNDINVIGYNIFDRITKEGRKYGVLLGLITQRPSELSTTALSQCSNYVVLRMFHPDDIQIVKNITQCVSENDIDKLKSLSSGSTLCFGTAFNIPTFCKLDIPDPTPASENVQIKSKWFMRADEIENKKLIQPDTQKNTIEIVQ